MSDPFIGKELSSVPFQVTPNLILDYSKGLNLDVESSRHIPSMIATGADNNYFAEIAYEYQSGHLWMRQEWELFKPLGTDKTYTVSGAIEDIYPRRNRNVVKYRVDIHEEGKQQPAVRSYHHQSFLSQKMETDTLEFRDPSKKPGMRKFIKPNGTEFGGNRHSITKEMCGVFFHGNANYHTDEKAASQLGFAEIVVGGRMTMAYVGNTLEEYFGDSWWHSGRIDLKFTNPVWCDDEITIRGIEHENQPADGRRSVFVWLEKADGTVAIVADASVQA